MRVFYVRPSDNGNYGIEEGLATLAPPPERVDLALFRGLRLPLQALNYDPSLRGLADLNRYDLVILAGVDPIIFSSRDHLALLAFVERGGGLMLVGGTHSFGNSEGTYLPLVPMLPVEIRRGLDVEVNALPRGAKHPIARGLPEPLGYISKVHPVEPTPGAEVALNVGDHPLAVTGEFGYGRIVVVASYPECREAEYGWFFTGDAFDDFLRAAVAWMMKEQHEVWIESFSLPTREVTTDSESFGKLLLNASASTQVRLTTKLTRDGRVVYEDHSRLNIEEARETLFSFRTPKEKDAGGVYYASVSLAGADGREVVRRDVAIEVANPTRAAIEFERGRRCLAPGDALRVHVHAFCVRRSAPSDLALDLSLIDSEGHAVHTEPRRTLSWQGSAYEDAEFELALPRLRRGTYRVRSELRAKNELLDVTTEDVDVVAPPRGDASFPLIAEGAVHLDRPAIERAVAMLDALGVNVVSLPGPIVHGWGERSHAEDMVAYASDRAARAALRVAHHRCALVPGFSPPEPLKPCPLDRAFRRALRSLATPILEAARDTAGLLSHEVLPHVAVRPDQVCRCDACLAAFRKNFEGELPKPDALAGLAPAERHAFYAFISSYWWAVYSMVEKLRTKVAPDVKLALTSGASSFLRDGHDAPYADVYSWARAADVIEVAPEADAARYRFSLAAHRGICQAEGKKLGAVIDLANPDLPPAEAAFTALVHGAESLRVAENPKFALWANQPPIEDALGDLFRRIGRAGPLLAACKRPKARLALVLPFTQMVDDGTGELLAAHELLCDSFGDVDILHQRLLTDQGLAGYQAVAILGTRMLRQKMLDALARFVWKGGVLLADSAELCDQKGRPLGWPDGFFAADPLPVFGAATIRQGTFGEGRTMLLSSGFAASYLTARRAPDPSAALVLRATVAHALEEAGVLPRTSSNVPHVELGLLTCQGAAVLVAVNHDAEDDASVTDLASEDVRAAFAFDLLTGEQEEVYPTDDGATAILGLKARDGRMWALFPDRPATGRIELLEEPAACGEECRARIVFTDDDGQQIEGSYPLRVHVLDPMGEDRPELGGEYLAIGGSLELMLPIAVNDPPGEWRLCVTEPLTGLCAHTTFTVKEGKANA